MKNICIIFFLLLAASWLRAQNVPKIDSIIPGNGSDKNQLKEIKKEKIILHSDSTGSEPKKTLVDTTVQNKYGDLLNDDTAYNKKSKWWKPAIKVVSSNLTTFLADRYIFKYDYSIQVGFSSWGHNLKTGWVWDTDRFGVNFFGHPYSGASTFNSARANGYNYWQSIPFSAEGSLLWEYFGENTLPSYNDLYNTTVNGALLGEIIYRLSSNILDDRTSGTQRFFRELAAGIIDPSREFGRIMNGKAFRKTKKEVYQKEPLNVTIYAGVQTLDNRVQDLFKTSTTNEILDLQLDYGNPFENRKRKPFDFFKLRIDLSYGVGRKILDRVTGYGYLTGRNYLADSGHKAMLVGIFQYYDYWDNKTFELGAAGFGAGVITKFPINKTKKSNLYTSLHLTIIPLAGTSTKFGPDTSQFRDYNYGCGLGGNFESTINFGRSATITMAAYYYYIHSYIGLKENNFIGILKPRGTIRLYKSLSIGFEEAVYYNHVHSPGLPVVHLNRTEQKLFLMLYLEDGQRRGRCHHAR